MVSREMCIAHRKTIWILIFLIFLLKCSAISEKVAAFTKPRKFDVRCLSISEPQSKSIVRKCMDVAKPNPILRLRGGESERKKILILDVDGTLYGPESRVEQQIVENIHTFAAKHYNLSKEECDVMHTKCGSTFAGLKEKYMKTTEEEQSFYHEVYGSLNLSGLLKFRDSDGDETGYKHQSDLDRILRGVQSPKYCASNSPLFHVHRVLAMLGLANVGWSGFITPDTRMGYTKSSAQYWKELLETHPIEQGYHLELIDDSQTNLDAAASLGMHTILVDSTFSAQQAILAHQGIIPRPSEWRFDTVGYLHAKNIVDTQSLNTHVWSRLAEECEKLFPTDKPLVVVDLGAGLLPMLHRVLTLPHDTIHYYALETEPNLHHTNGQALTESGFTLSDIPDRLGPRYVTDRCTVTLVTADFRRLPPGTFAHAGLFVGSCFADLFPPAQLLRAVTSLAGPGRGALLYLPITFTGSTRLDPPQLRCGDVPGDAEVMQAYHAGLVQEQGHYLDPTALIARARGMGAEVLAQGPSPWGIPWDGLEVGGRDGYAPAAGEADGAGVARAGAAGRMWESMLHFFGTGVAAAAAERRWDLPAWVRRCRRVRPTIEASNVDVLFRLYDAACPLPVTAAGPVRDAAGAGGAGRREVLTFVAPRRVVVTAEAAGGGVRPGPGELVVRAERSMVSSGTELKVFRGDMERDAQLDVTIKGMADAGMRYPLEYGYSLVGVVTAVGEGVEGGEARWRGKRVFAFAAHGSHALVAAADVLLVPEGIDADDACYLPAVETALSLVQEARPMVGERVGVFGQGVIGLLVTGILAGGGAAAGTDSDNVYAVEMNPDRAALARLLGAGHVIHPAILNRTHPLPASEAPPDAHGGPGGEGEEEGGEERRDVPELDVAIEVSGSAGGLQSAIDATGRGGRVVIGSWYGAGECRLRLGLDFHRSHVTLVTSQVSRIPGQLSERWDKARRFEEAWRWVRRLRPGRVITSMWMPLRRAQEAYEALDRGATIAVEFTYD